MARYGVKSEMNAAEVIRRAQDFFGPAGLGLEMTECSLSQVSFSGGGGYVAVSACDQDEGSAIELETREWDFQVRRFIEQI